MSSDKVLVFDITGEYGHFRKFNTTTSPLTYPIPTRPALAGLIGAVLGVERETSPGVFPPEVIPISELFHPEKMSIAVQILRPVKKAHLAFNLINTKMSFYDIDTRTQIEFEFLKDPAFRIFFQHTDESVFETLAERISARKYHFTPCLGLAQLAALVELHGVLPCKVVENVLQTPIEIISAINLSQLTTTNLVHFGTGYYTVDTYPLVLQKDREVSAFAEVLVERKGGTISVQCPIYWEVQGLGNILFL